VTVIQRDDNLYVAIDEASGIAGLGLTPGDAIDDLDCKQYTSNSDSRSGQLLNQFALNILPANCETLEAPIACCAPVAVPVTPQPTP